MSYPGNTSLAGAVKDRVVSTFQQTLALYHQGRRDDVSAGCTLILQMDPTFEPARKLLDKIRNPSLPIDVDRLMPTDGVSAMEQARKAMAERDFQRTIQITTDVLTEDLLNDEARILGDEAREKMEAGPFVEQFARKVDQAIAAGNRVAAKADLEKMRSLDPEHPDVARLDQALAGRAGGPPPPSPSFVVDDRPSAPPGSGRSTAQAADFGFAFEEEKPAAQPGFANFSFDRPAQSFSFDGPAPPPPEATPFGAFSFDSPGGPKEAASGEFDFTTASAASAEDQTKIEQYLAEGDRAAAAGNHQQAIDLWSRIFLIDVTNDQASERIEQAKVRRREVDQKVESLLVRGIAAFERGDTAMAHADLSEVLRLDPANASAKDYLGRLSETVVEGTAPARSNPYSPPSASETGLDLDFFDDSPPGGSFDTPIIPRDPMSSTQSSAPGKRTTPPPPKPRTERRLPMGLILTIAGLLVLGGGGWFAWSRFKNKPEADPAVAQQTLARATSLANRGKYDEAIALLQDIKPADPEHDRALVMISDLQIKKSTSAQMIDGIPAAQYYDQRLEAARAAFDAHDFTAAKAALEQAMRVKPLPADMRAQYDAAAQQVAKLDAAKALFAERKYSEAISNLQSLLDQDPSNQNVNRIIIDAHFNMGAQALQEERVQDAIHEFEEVLKRVPDDELAKRSRDLALRYDGEPKDLLYKIYVKYLPTRAAS
jgi:tetratricopeptide (TPR) repeat protein